MTSPDLDSSYEAFTRRPFYRAIDRETIRLAPASRCVLDVAAGTGAMTELLLEENRLLAGGSVLGFDIDPTAVEAARRKFADYPNIVFVEGSCEAIPAAVDSFDLAVFGNAIHLTDVPKSLSEIARVVSPGGTLVLSSAYSQDAAYPGGSGRLWGRLAVGALRRAKEQGYAPTRPVDLFTYTVAQYEELVRKAGFSEVTTRIITVNMDRDDVKAISNYDCFANGSLPGVPTDLAKQFLTAAADELFDRLEQEGREACFPRGWMLLCANKQTLHAALA